MQDNALFYNLSDTDKSLINEYYCNFRSNNTWKSSHKYRLFCDDRIVLRSEFEDYLEGDEMVILHDGLPEVGLDVPLDGAVVAICVNDYTTATMLGLIIEDYKLEVAENA